MKSGIIPDGILMEAGSSPAPSAKNYNMWLKESNRPKHLLYAIPASFVGTILFSTGLAFGMEFKDK